MTVKIIELLKKIVGKLLPPDENVLMYIKANEALPSHLSPEEEVVVMAD